MRFDYCAAFDPFRGCLWLKELGEEAKPVGADCDDWTRFSKSLWENSLRILGYLVAFLSRRNQERISLSTQVDLLFRHYTTPIMF
jgi:hypothetical protein